jgi:hypothetical protein
MLVIPKKDKITGHIITWRGNLSGCAKKKKNTAAIPLFEIGKRGTKKLLKL